MRVRRDTGHDPPNRDCPDKSGRSGNPTDDVFIDSDSVTDAFVFVNSAFGIVEDSAFVALDIVADKSDAENVDSALKNDIHCFDDAE